MLIARRIVSSSAHSLARASPAGFAYHASGQRWIPAEHLLHLSEKLVDVAAGRCKRLMVFMPPRHGKSELISKYFPAWYLGRFPDNQVILTSYSDQFAAAWGRRARDEFDENCERLFGLKVNKETAGGSSWEVADRDGIMVTAGVGGGITGKGAHLMIIDDPVKNASDAASGTIQQAHIDWWKSTARTRLMPGGAVVLVMTRWHEGDLAGQLLKAQMEEDGDEWEIISLPGLAEESCSASYPEAQSIDLGPDPLGREMGAPLWPEFYAVEDLHKTRAAMGTYWFNAMYQQRPSAAEGNLFKKTNFRYFEKRDGLALIHHQDERGLELFDPSYCKVKFCTVDCAESEKKSADYSVISTWIVTVNSDLLLWDRQREQYERHDLKAMIKRVFYVQQPQIVFIENASAGTWVIKELTLEGLPVVPLNADADKITRSWPAIARYEEHRIFHPMGEGFEWVKKEWEPELLGFPNTSNDDQVDTVAYAGMQLPFLGGVTREAGGVSKIRSGKGTLTGGLMTRRL